MADGAGTARLRVDLAYDGGPFHGFARQPGFPTVQGVLEDALFRVFGQEVVTTCAGRTDRGVHARGQVVHGDVSLAPEDVAGRGRRTLVLVEDVDAARNNLDHAVGDAITIWAVRVVPDSFDARFSAIGRSYRYRFSDAVAIDPLSRHDAWHVRGGPLDVEAMHEAAQHLVGELDFASLCKKVPGRTTMRRVTSTEVVRVGPGDVHLRIHGNAFCYNQVRSIAGCLAEVGLGKRTPEWMAEVLAAKDRSVAAAVAPPRGLVLEQVQYRGDFPPSASGPLGPAPPGPA